MNKKNDIVNNFRVYVIDTGNGKVHSSNVKASTSNGNSTVSDISGNAKTSISSNNDISSNAMTYISNGNSNVSNNAKTSSSESEYIGLGVLTGRENNSDMELEVESQKRSHPDSDSVDSVDDSSFAAPLAPPLVPPKRSQLLSSLRALLGPLLLIVIAAAVGPLNAHLLPLVPPRLALMLCHLLLVMCRSLPGALVALRAPNRGDSYSLKWLYLLSS